MKDYSDMFVLKIIIVINLTIIDTGARLITSIKHFLNHDINVIRNFRYYWPLNRTHNSYLKNTANVGNSMDEAYHFINTQILLDVIRGRIITITIDNSYLI